MTKSKLSALLLMMLWLLAGTEAKGQQPAPTDAAGMMTLRPNTGYQRPAFWRALLGDTWRAVWAAPITVPVLDLGSFGGGLTPFKEGGNQSKTLRFHGADGHTYIFRSVNKNITNAMPKDLRHSPAGALVQDQISALHPSAPLPTDVMEEAVGVWHARPRLVVMPDDPRLGEFRETFRGMLGEIEERPDEGKGAATFGGAKKIVGTDKLLEKLEESLENRIDSREYLRARLMDFIFGDTDRGADQWRWAKYEREGFDVYRPIPRDRDYAFMHTEGLLLKLAAHAYPKLTHFGPEFPGIASLVFMTREFDRSHLVDLPRASWDSIVADIQRRLTDQVIDQAVAQLPDPQESLSANQLRAGLRARRDHLPEIAHAFFDLVNRDADIFASDDDEHAYIEHKADGSVSVEIRRAQDAKVVFNRTFTPDATRGIRVFMERGNDRVLVRGSTAQAMTIRVVGGEGDDVLMDSSTTVRGDETRFYDATGNNTFVTGARTAVIRKKFTTEQPRLSADDDEAQPEGTPRLITEERRGRQQDLMNSEMGEVEKKTRAEYTRNWGVKTSLTPVIEYHDGPGFIIGFGPTTTNFGFRRRPYEWQTSIRGLYGTGSGGFGVRLASERRFEVAPLSVTIFAHATQLEANRFFGWGNDTPLGDVKSSLIMRDELLVAPAVNFLVGEQTRLSVGPVARITRARHLPSYGQLGGQIEFASLNAERKVLTQRGLDFSMGGSGYPALLDVANGFGEAHALAKLFVPLGRPTLALRAGGKRVWGDAPLHESAFIGAAETVRGYRWNRFVGDASAYGSAEVHLPIAYVTLLTRGELGLIGFTDAGRVWYNGDSAGGWHTSFGGGLSFGSLDHTLSVTYARGEESRMYFTFGFPF